MVTSQRWLLGSPLVEGKRGEREVREGEDDLWTPQPPRVRVREPWFRAASALTPVLGHVWLAQQLHLRTLLTLQAAPPAQSELAT